MHLYNLTLQRATGITQAIHGNFSGTKQQEILISRGKILELLRPDSNTGKIYTVLSVEIFGVVRSMLAVKLTGGTKDYIVIGSDSGRIVILEYQPAKNQFEKIHQETFGKTGCRRIVPGQYLAADPKGRAIMIGAIEKQKLAYVLNRDDQARLTISSPLEAHKSNTIVAHMVGVDHGFNNPIFACLEIDYEEADSDPTGETAQKTQQILSFYQFDVSSNHVVRTYSEPLEEHTNFLISVPGDKDGPSGVLICSENYLTYKNLGDQPDIRCPIPRRRNDLDDPERGMIFVCAATHKTKSMFFFLAQTEQGDIFKITLETDKDSVTEIKMKYFDTVPVATSMCVLKTGFLFVACEFGNHYLYQIAHLGDDDDEPEFSSAIPLEEGDTFFFAPRALLNLVLIDEMESLSPIMDSQVAEIVNDDTQIYALCGRGPRSSVRVLRHGLEVTEMAVSELPGNPSAVWTVKRRLDDKFDTYIVVSFINKATLVLSIGETVEEVTNSGFCGTVLTLCCASLAGNGFVQIIPNGVRHIRSSGEVREWPVPYKKEIIRCAVNQRQVVIAFARGELAYFEMNAAGILDEYKEHKQMDADIVCMALGAVEPGKQRTNFLAVGLANSVVRILSLDPNECLSPRASQSVPAIAESLCIVEMGGGGPNNDQSKEDGPAVSTSTMYLYEGLQSGVLLRTVIDPVTGELKDARSKYLGNRSVKLFRIKIQEQEAVLAMSSRSWLSYYYQNRFYLTPLSYEPLEYASGFASEQCSEGIVAISQNSLRILALEKLGAVFNQTSHPLEYTPRKFAIHPLTNHLVIIETDHNAYTEATKKQRREQMALEMCEAADENEQELAREMAQAFLKEDLPESIFSAPKAGNGMWASLVRVLDTNKEESLVVHRMEQNEAAFSMCLLRFNDQPTNTYHVVVGLAKDFQLNPRHVTTGYLDTYLLNHDCSEMKFLHRTAVNEVPQALCAYQGRLLVGVGKVLRLYDLGKKKMLRKCENKYIPHHIVDIKAIGQRVIVADIQESVYMVRYRKRENQLIIFADDTVPRWVTTTCALDYDTVGVADKFGNIAVVRIGNDVSDDVDEDPTGNKALWDRGLLNGASQKVETIASFHVGELITSLQKVTLIPGGPEALVYGTINGSIGALVPFTSPEDHDFFQHLEMHMRSENPPLCGRDHLSYRSCYFPVKNVLDGDLCEQYNILELKKQKSIAEDLDGRSPADVAKKLEDIRTRYAF